MSLLHVVQIWHVGKKAHTLCQRVYRARLVGRMVAMRTTKDLNQSRVEIGSVVWVCSGPKRIGPRMANEMIAILTLTNKLA